MDDKVKFDGVDIAVGSEEDVKQKDARRQKRYDKERERRKDVRHRTKVRRGNDAR